MREQSVEAAPILITAKSAMVGERQVWYELYRCNGKFRLTLRDDWERWNEYEENEAEAKAILDLLYRNGVTPCTFADIIRDRRYELTK